MRPTALLATIDLLASSVSGDDANQPVDPAVQAM
jgi:hypothetical protein